MLEKNFKNIYYIASYIIMWKAFLAVLKCVYVKLLKPCIINMCGNL